MHKSIYVLLTVVLSAIAIGRVNSAPQGDSARPALKPVNRTDLIVGTWKPHSRVADTWWPTEAGHASQEQLGQPQSDPHTDGWQLTFAADGNAAFTGKEHYVGRGPKSPPNTVDTWLSRDFDVRGKWDMTDNSLSIVTDEPSIKTWHLIAITESHLVLRQQTSRFSLVDGRQVPDSVDMFWVRQ